MLKTAVKGKGSHPFYFMLFMIGEQGCGSFQSFSNWVASLNSERAFIKISLKTKFAQFAILTLGNKSSMAKTQNRPRGKNRVETTGWYRGFQSRLIIVRNNGTWIFWNSWFANPLCNSSTFESDTPSPLDGARNGCGHWRR